MTEKISKTQIERRLRNKTNLILVNTIIQLKKTNPQIAKLLASPRKKQDKINLNELNRRVKENEHVLFIGKVLGDGNIEKKIKIVASSFSESAKEKLRKGKSEILNIEQEMNKNPKLSGLKLIN